MSILVVIFMYCCMKIRLNLNQTFEYLTPNFGRASNGIKTIDNEMINLIKLNNSSFVLCKN